MDEVILEKPPQLSEKSNGAENPVDKYTSKNGMLETQELSNRPVCIKLQRVSANWISGQLPPTLCNISMTVKPGKLCALVGAVGSGKSSVLHLLLRELNPGAGCVFFIQNASQNQVQSKASSSYLSDYPNLRISYASQEPWLFGGTVRDNILFGQTYDRTRYTQVIQADIFEFSKP